MGSINTRCRKREHGKRCDGVSRPEGANARTAPSDRLGIVSHSRRTKWSEDLDVSGKERPTSQPQWLETGISSDRYGDGWLVAARRELASDHGYEIMRLLPRRAPSPAPFDGWECNAAASGLKGGSLHGSIEKRGA